VSAQLAAAQQREAEARQDAEEIHGMFQDLSARVQQDEEAATQIRKEQDKLLQKDVEASKWAVDLLAELEMERDLKLRAKERSTTLQQRVNLDAKLIARLRRERDKLRQTVERLCSERGMGCEEHD